MKSLRKGTALPEKVAVGMSGGIDSTVTAYLLKEEGYEVVGLTMKIWDGPAPREPAGRGCYGPGGVSDIEDAKRAASVLGIRHFVIDVRSDYEKDVLDYFSTEYARGRTPNPCVVCNARIKFGSFIGKARSGGIPFDLFATGHYARVRRDAATGRYNLLRGLDGPKDQSYFLYRLSQEQLSRILFPLGDHAKKDVKELALKAGFAECLKRRESQDFLELADYASLLKDPPVPGDIVDAAGNVIGRHRGIAFYTIGQRRSLGLAGMKEPHYVVRIDTARNEIVAGRKAELMNDGLRAENVHWIAPFDDRPEGPVTAKIRSTAPAAPCRADPLRDGSLAVYFDEPQESITPGQSVVLYAGDCVLGGGTITEAFRK